MSARENAARLRREEKLMTRFYSLIAECEKAAMDPARNIDVWFLARAGRGFLQIIEDRKPEQDYVVNVNRHGGVQGMPAFLAMTAKLRNVAGVK